MVENKLVKFMLENKESLMLYASNLTKNRQVAEDLYQETIRYFVDKNFNEIEVESPNTYAKQAIKHRFFNRCTMERKYFFGREDDYDFSGVVDENISDEKMMDSITFKKVMRVAKKILPKKQYKALLISVDTDQVFFSVDGKSPETNKSHRRYAIERLKQYFNRG